MTIKVRVPVLGESVAEATVGKWYKAVGDAVAIDEVICELETDKVALEVTASAAGALAEITASEGDNVEVGALLGKIDETANAPSETTTANSVSDKPEIPLEAPAKAQEKVVSNIRPAAAKLVSEKGIDLIYLILILRLLLPL